MKFEDLLRGYEIFDEIIGLDLDVILTLAAMMIDFVSVKFNEDPMKTVDRLRNAVQCVNAEQGRMVVWNEDNSSV